MIFFKALLRGFKDLADGSGTATLDIPDSHYPTNTKQFKQKYGFWVTGVDEDTLHDILEGNGGERIDRIQVYNAMLSIVEDWRDELTEKKKEAMEKEEGE